MKGTITGTGSINGKGVESVSVQFVGERLVVTTTQEAVDPEPAPKPPVTPEPDNWRGPTINLEKNGTRTEHYLSPGAVKTWELRTSDDPKLSGDINISEKTEYEKVSRRMWLSETPGGPPLPGRRSKVEGNSGRKLSWTQAPRSTFNILPLRQHLVPGQTYYLNIEALNGPPRSGMYLTFGSKA
jgi:hypothetical protein